MSKEGAENERLCAKVALLTKVVQALNAQVEDADRTLSVERCSRSAALARASAAARAALSAVSLRLDPAALVERYERVLADIGIAHAAVIDEAKRDLNVCATTFAAALEAREVGLVGRAAGLEEVVRGAKNELTVTELRLRAHQDAEVASANDARNSAERALADYRELCAVNFRDLLAERDAALSTAREAGESAADAVRAGAHLAEVKQECIMREKQIKEDAAVSLSAMSANHSAEFEAAQSHAQQLLLEQELKAVADKERLASEIKTLELRAAENLERHRLECAALVQSLRNEAKSAEAIALAACKERELKAAAVHSDTLRNAREDAGRQISSLYVALEAEKCRVEEKTQFFETEKRNFLNKLAEEQRLSRTLSARVSELEVAVSASDLARCVVKTELDSATKQLSTCSSERDNLSARNTLLSRELDESTTRLAELEQLALKHADSERTVESLRVSLAVCEGRAALLDDERQSLIGSACIANATLRAAELSISTLEAKVHDLSAQLEVSRAAKAQLERCEVVFALERSELMRRLAQLESEMAALEKAHERAMTSSHSTSLLLQTELTALRADLAAERTARADAESAATRSAELVASIAEKTRSDLAAARAHEEASLFDLRLHAAELAEAKRLSVLEEKEMRARHEDAIARALASQKTELDTRHQTEIDALSNSATSYSTQSIALACKEAAEQAAAGAFAAKEHEAAALDSLREALSNEHARAIELLRCSHKADRSFLQAQCRAAIDAAKERTDEQLKQAALERQRLEAALFLSRPEDVVRIERLVSLVKLKDDECKLFRLELANREANFNRVFGGGEQARAVIAYPGSHQAGLASPGPLHAEPPRPGASVPSLAAGSGVRAVSALQRVGSPRPRGGATEGRSPPPAPSQL